MIGLLVFALLWPRFPVLLVMEYLPDLDYVEPNEEIPNPFEASQCARRAVWKPMPLTI